MFHTDDPHNSVTRSANVNPFLARISTYIRLIPEYGRKTINKPFHVGNRKATSTKSFSNMSPVFEVETRHNLIRGFQR